MAYYIRIQCTIDYLCLLFVGDNIKRYPRPIIRYFAGLLEEFLKGMSVSNSLKRTPP
jgi:hypothetical protein